MKRVGIELVQVPGRIDPAQAGRYPQARLEVMHSEKHVEPEMNAVFAVPTRKEANSVNVPSPIPLPSSSPKKIATFELPLLAALMATARSRIPSRSKSSATKENTAAVVG